MNILLVNTLYYPYKVGGAEISVQLLAESLVEQGHIVTVVCIHENNERKDTEYNGVNIIYLPYSNIYWGLSTDEKNPLKKIIWHLTDLYNFKIANEFKKILSQIKPDIVHTNNLSGISCAIWKKAKKNECKVIHTSRDYYLIHPNCKLYKNGSEMSVHSSTVLFWSFIKKVLCKNVDAYVGISNYIKDKHIESGFFKAAQKYTIYNSVKSNSIPIQSNFGVKNVGFIGRLTKEKGFDQFCALASQNPTKKFIAAGEFDKESDSLKELAHSSNVDLLGYCPVEQFMQKVDLIVLPIKWQEPFGRVVVEAIFGGKVVLTNRVGGIAELAEILPNIYFLEDTLDIDNIPAPIEIDREVKEVFDVNFVTEQYLNIYKGVMQ